MGLAAILVDRARTVSLEPAPEKVDGTTKMVPVTGDWFKCRLQLPESPETAAPGSAASGGPMRTTRTPALYFKPLVGTSDPPVKASDRIEVLSPQLGQAVWRVVAAPGPWRKKRKVIGFQVTLERDDEYEMTPP